MIKDYQQQKALRDSYDVMGVCPESSGTAIPSR